MFRKSRLATKIQNATQAMHETHNIWAAYYDCETILQEAKIDIPPALQIAKDQAGNRYDAKFAALQRLQELQDIL